MENRKFGLSFKYDSEKFSIANILGISQVIKKHNGLNIVVDPCKTASLEFFHLLSDYIDVVSIPWDLVVLLNDHALMYRLKCYKSIIEKVMVDGKLMEKAIMNNVDNKILQKLKEFNFDVVEIIESPFISMEKIINVIKKAKGLDFQTAIKLFSVYKTKLYKRIGGYLDAGVDLVIIPLCQDIYPPIVLGEDNKIVWETLYSLVDEISLKKIVFDVERVEAVQTLMEAFGPNINLHIRDFRKLIEFEAVRIGLKMPIDLSNILKKIKGGASTKFVYFILATEGAKDLKELMKITKLPIRTIQEALKKLQESGFIKSVPKPDSEREKIWMAIK